MITMSVCWLTDMCEKSYLKLSNVYIFFSFVQITKNTTFVRVSVRLSTPAFVNLLKNLDENGSRGRVHIFMSLDLGSFRPLNSPHWICVRSLINSRSLFRIFLLYCDILLKWPVHIGNFSSFGKWRNKNKST